MKPTRSVLVLSGVLACSWAGSGVGQEQQNPLQIFKDALKTAKDALKTALPPKTGETAQIGASGAPGEPAAGAYEGRRSTLRSSRSRISKASRSRTIK